MRARRRAGTAAAAGARGEAGRRREEAKTLAPFADLLARSLALLAARRAVAWLASSVAFLAAGTGVAALLRLPASSQTALILAAVSVLPACLLWPPPPGHASRRFRSLDADTTVEAFLEAPPGPARELLASRAAASARALRLSEPPKEMPYRGLWPYVLAAAAAVAALEAGSLIALRRPMVAYEGAEPAPGSGARTEEGDFAPFGETDPASLAALGESAESGAAGDQGEAGALRDEAVEGLPGGRRARDRGEDLPDIGGGEGEGPARPGAERDARGDSLTEGEGESGTVAGEPAAGETAGPATERGEARRGRGYENTGDTRVPSPLVDYRARMDSVYVERTGKRYSASGELSLGELREYQRRYFASFSLRAGIERSEDPEAALMRRRWRELRAGLE